MPVVVEVLAVHVVQVRIVLSGVFIVDPVGRYKVLPFDAGLVLNIVLKHWNEIRKPFINNYIYHELDKTEAIKVFNMREYTLYKFHTYTPTYRHTRVIHIHTHTYTHTCHTHTHVYTHTCHTIHTRIHTHVSYTYTRIHTHTCHT